MDVKRIGLMIAVGWVLIKLVLFNLEVDHAFEIGAGVNILFLLIVIFVAIRAHFQQGGRTLFLDDVKAGMRQAGVYALIVSGFIFAYYKWIDADYLPDLIDARVESAATEIEKAGGWEAYVEKMNDPVLEEVTFADYLDDVRETGEQMITPGTALGLSLVALVSISFFYALIIAALYRRVLSKFEGSNRSE